MRLHVPVKEESRLESWKEARKRQVKSGLFMESFITVTVSKGFKDLHSDERFYVTPLTLSRTGGPRGNLPNTPRRGRDLHESPAPIRPGPAQEYLTRKSCRYT